MNSKFKKNIFLCSSLFFLFNPFLVFAENTVEENANSQDPAYPGEIKNTNNGKQVKLWSTKGPVPVSKAPQPFQNPQDQSIPDNTLLNVDGRQNAIRSQTQNQPYRQNAPQVIPPTVIKPSSNTNQDPPSKLNSPKLPSTKLQSDQPQNNLTPE